jgi:DUF917 family protein
MSFDIAPADLPALALGSGILGCGGGGNPYYARLIGEEVLAHTGPVRVIDLAEMDPDRCGVMSVAMGAPLVGLEKPPSIRALRAGFAAVEGALRAPPGAFVAAEVGGMECMLPLVMAGLTGRPLLDGDGMGRAFPEAQMCTFLLYGSGPGLPAALSDDHGLIYTFSPWLRPLIGSRIGGTDWLGRVFGLAIERGFRRYCAYKGGVIYFTATLDHASLQRTLVRNTIRLALELGRAITSARAAGDDPIAAIQRIAGGKRFLDGKVVDVERRFRRAHDWGVLRLEGIGEDRGRRVAIDFKNEYLVLRVDERVALTVPELIAVIETETGAPLTTEVLRPGLRASVLGFPCTPLYRTPEALRVVGPAAFGYELPLVALG